MSAIVCTRDAVPGRERGGVARLDLAGGVDAVGEEDDHAAQGIARLQPLHGEAEAVGDRGGPPEMPICAVSIARATAATSKVGGCAT